MMFLRRLVLLVFGALCIQAVSSALLFNPKGKYYTMENDLMITSESGAQMLLNATLGSLYVVTPTGDGGIRLNDGVLETKSHGLTWSRRFYQTLMFYSVNMATGSTVEGHLVSDDYTTNNILYTVVPVTFKLTHIHASCDDSAGDSEYRVFIYADMINVAQVNCTVPVSYRTARCELETPVLVVEGKHLSMSVEAVTGYGEELLYYGQGYY